MPPPKRPFTTSSLTNSIKSTIASQPLLSNLTNIDKLSTHASSLAQKTPFFGAINQQFNNQNPQQQHQQNDAQSFGDRQAQTSANNSSFNSSNSNNNNNSSSSTSSTMNRGGPGQGAAAAPRAPMASTPTVDMSHLTEEERLMIQSVMAKAEMADMGIPVDTSAPSSTNMPSNASQVLTQQTRQHLARQQHPQQQNPGYTEQINNNPHQQNPPSHQLAHNQSHLNQAQITGINPMNPMGGVQVSSAQDHMNILQNQPNQQQQHQQPQIHQQPGNIMMRNQSFNQPTYQQYQNQPTQNQLHATATTSTQVQNQLEPSRSQLPSLEHQTQQLVNQINSQFNLGGERQATINNNPQQQHQQQANQQNMMKYEPSIDLALDQSNQRMQQQQPQANLANQSMPGQMSFQQPQNFSTSNNQLQQFETSPLNQLQAQQTQNYQQQMNQLMDGVPVNRQLAGPIQNQQQQQQQQQHLQNVAQGQANMSGIQSQVGYVNQQQQPPILMSDNNMVGHQSNQIAQQMLMTPQQQQLVQQNLMNQQQQQDPSIYGGTHLQQQQQPPIGPIVDQTASFVSPNMVPARDPRQDIRFGPKNPASEGDYEHAFSDHELQYQQQSSRRSRPVSSRDGREANTIGNGDMVNYSRPGIRARGRDQSLDLQRERDLQAYDLAQRSSPSNGRHKVRQLPQPGGLRQVAKHQMLGDRSIQSSAEHLHEQASNRRIQSSSSHPKQVEQDPGGQRPIRRTNLSKSPKHKRNQTTTTTTTSATKSPRYQHSSDSEDLGDDGDDDGDATSLYDSPSERRTTSTNKQQQHQHLTKTPSNQSTAASRLDSIDSPKDLDKSEKALKLLSELKLTEQANQVMEQQQLLIKQSQELIKLQQAQLEQQQASKKQEVRRNSESSNQQQQQVDSSVSAKTNKQNQDEDEARDKRAESIEVEEPKCNEPDDGIILSDEDLSSSQPKQAQNQKQQQQQQRSSTKSSNKKSTSFSNNNNRDGGSDVEDTYEDACRTRSKQTSKRAGNLSNELNDNNESTPDSTMKRDKMDATTSTTATAKGQQVKKSSANASSQVDTPNPAAAATTSSASRYNQHHRDLLHSPTDTTDSDIDIVSSSHSAVIRRPPTGRQLASSLSSLSKQPQSVRGVMRRREPTGLPPSPLPVAAAIQLHHMQQQHLSRQQLLNNTNGRTIQQQSSTNFSRANFLRSRSVTSSPNHLFERGNSGYLTDNSQQNRIYRPSSPDTLSEYGGQRRRKRLPEPPQNAVPITPSMVRKMIQAQKVSATSSGKLLTSVNAQSTLLTNTHSTRNPSIDRPHEGSSQYLGSNGQLRFAPQPSAANQHHHHQLLRFKNEQPGAHHSNPTNNSNPPQEESLKSHQEIANNPDLSKFLTSTYGNSILKSSPHHHHSLVSDVKETPELDKMISNLDEYYGLDRGHQRQQTATQSALNRLGTSSYHHQSSHLPLSSLLSPTRHLAGGPTQTTTSTITGLGGPMSAGPTQSYLPSAGSMLRRNSDGEYRTSSGLLANRSAGVGTLGRPLYRQSTLATNYNDSLRTNPTSYNLTTSTTNHPTAYHHHQHLPIDSRQPASYSSSPTHRTVATSAPGATTTTAYKLGQLRQQYPSNSVSMTSDHATRIRSPYQDYYRQPPAASSIATTARTPNYLGQYPTSYQASMNANEMGPNPRGDHMEPHSYRLPPTSMNYQHQNRMPMTRYESRHLAGPNLETTTDSLNYGDRYDPLMSRHQTSRDYALYGRSQSQMGTTRPSFRDTRYGGSVDFDTSSNNLTGPGMDSFDLEHPVNQVNNPSRMDPMGLRSNHLDDRYRQPYQDLNLASRSNQLVNSGLAPMTKDDIIRNGPKFTSIGYRFRTENQNKYVIESRAPIDCLQTKYPHPYKRILLSKNPKDRIGNGIGVRITGGLPMPNIYDKVNRCIITSGAFVTQVFQDSNVYLMDELHEGDQIIEWNGVNLCNRSDEEVEQILLSQFSDDEVEIVYLNRDKFYEAYEIPLNTTDSSGNKLEHYDDYQQHQQQRPLQAAQLAAGDEPLQEDDPFETFSKLHKSGHSFRQQGGSRYANETSKVGSIRRKLSLSSISHIWSR